MCWTMSQCPCHCVGDKETVMSTVKSDFGGIKVEVPAKFSLLFNYPEDVNISIERAVVMMIFVNWFV